MRNTVILFLIAAMSMLSGRLSAANPPPIEAAAFQYQKKIVYSLQDAAMTMPDKLFSRVGTGEPVKLEPSYEASLNVFLIVDRASGRRCLIDAGYGNDKSMLGKAMAALKIAPDSIEAIFITHIHPDHVGGLTTEEGTAAFAKATLYIARQEYEAWSKDSARAQLAKHLEPYRERMVLIDYNREISAFGLTPLSMPGHTPGHTVYRLNAAPGTRLYFVGDIVHAAELQIPHPQFCARFDADPKQAVTARKAMLRNGIVWFGAHIPFPGKATIKARGKSFGFQIEPKEKSREAIVF